MFTAGLDTTMDPKYPTRGRLSGSHTLKAMKGKIFFCFQKIFFYLFFFYFRWWDAMWKAAKERGDSEVCFTTEFGPPNYQVKNSLQFSREILLEECF